MPLNEEKCVDIHMLNQRVSRLEDSMPRDDLGKPAFDWHREQHTKQQRSDQRLSEYQHEVTKKILAWGLGALLATLGAGYSEHLIEFLRLFIPS